MTRGGRPIVSQAVHAVGLPEGRIAEGLTAIQARYPALDVGSYPTSDQGLQALISKPSDATGWAGPYVKSGKLPEDPWNHAYIYRSPSSRADHDFDLCSAGPNVQNSAAGSNGQICNQ